MLWAMVQHKYYYEKDEIDTHLDECEYPNRTLLRTVLLLVVIPPLLMIGDLVGIRGGPGRLSNGITHHCRRAQRTRRI